jgi:conjugative transfer region lipoprotein (TIGR03751 family)
MRSNSIKGLALAAAVAVLGGCATSKEELLTHSDRTMMDIWQQETGGASGGAGQVARRQLLDARQSLRRPLTDADVQAAPAEQMRYTRMARNEVYRQFQRLPNPDLVMYVYPHLAGTDPVDSRRRCLFARCPQALHRSGPGQRERQSHRGRPKRQFAHRHIRWCSRSAAVFVPRSLPRG